MRNKKLFTLIQQLENFLECWKQFNRFVNVAREKKFDAEDESQFLELKTVIAHELELIFASIESGGPDKDEVLTLITGAPSLRFLSEMNESTLRGIESRWHRIYINWQSILGQLKVRQMEIEDTSFLSGLFGRKDS